MAGSLAMKYFSNGKMIVSSPFENGDIYIYTIDYNIYIYYIYIMVTKWAIPFPLVEKS